MNTIVTVTILLLERYCYSNTIVTVMLLLLERYCYSNAIVTVMLLLLERYCYSNAIVTITLWLHAVLQFFDKHHEFKSILYTVQYCKFIVEKFKL